MEQREIEIIRMMQEQIYRQTDSTAILVAVMSEEEYDATIKDYQARGYKLIDVSQFGEGSRHIGDFLAFVKNKEKNYD
jgi:hypothetical protein